jgi:glucans biosynthesis protein
MHGGAKGSGAPKGSKNAFKHGLYSKEAITTRREVTAIIRQWKELSDDMS